jgi:antitoxin YefM
MRIQTTDSHACANLASLWDEVTPNREVVIIQRRGAEDAALISAEELTGLFEAMHLMRSPVNADRLLAAYGRAMKGESEAQIIQVIPR